MFLKAFGLAAAIVFFTDWYFFGVLFHSRYHSFPGVWRKYENKKDEIRSITYGTLVSFVVCALFILISDHVGVRGFGDSLSFAAALWLIGPISSLISCCIFMNFDRSVAFSHALGWLVRFVAPAVGVALFY